MRIEATSGKRGRGLSRLVAAAVETVWTLSHLRTGAGASRRRNAGPHQGCRPRYQGAEPADLGAPLGWRRPESARAESAGGLWVVLLALLLRFRLCFCGLGLVWAWRQGPGCRLDLRVGRRRLGCLGIGLPAGPRVFR